MSDIQKPQTHNAPVLAGIFTVLLISLIVMGVYFMVAVSAKTEDVKRVPYKCVEGYKFVNGKQMVNENGGGIPCSDDFVLPNTLGIR